MALQDILKKSLVRCYHLSKVPGGKWLDVRTLEKAEPSDDEFLSDVFGEESEELEGDGVETGESDGDLNHEAAHGHSQLGI